MAAPATAEQATPEEIPRPIHPFLQRNSPDFSEQPLRAVQRCKGSLRKQRKTTSALEEALPGNGRASTAMQALPRLRTERDHRQRPGVPQPKRARRYYGQKGRRCEPALDWSERSLFMYTLSFVIRARQELESNSLSTKLANSLK